jgi:hypothetical protein
MLSCIARPPSHRQTSHSRLPLAPLVGRARGTGDSASLRSEGAVIGTIRVARITMSTRSRRDTAWGPAHFMPRNPFDLSR